MALHLALTGITSGVGMQVAQVAIARGHRVSGLVRSPDRADARALAAMGARLIPGDLEDRAALAEMARGADVVLHLAAHVGDRGTRELFERVNVGGTERALDAAKAGGARRFVHLSSSAVYGRPERGRVTEAWPTRMSGLPYEDTKTMAERVAFERGRALGLEVVAVRPPIIYGPNDRNFLPRVKEALAKKRFLLIDGGRAPLNLVWVEHVVDVVLLAAERPNVDGEAFNVMDEVDRMPPSVREVAETIARETGLPPPSLRVPYPIAMAAGYALQAFYKARGIEDPPPVSPFVVKILTRHVIYDASKAVRLLGWVPRKRALEGIAEVARASVAS